MIEKCNSLLGPGIQLGVHIKHWDKLCCYEVPPYTYEQFVDQLTTEYNNTCKKDQVFADYGSKLLQQCFSGGSSGSANNTYVNSASVNCVTDVVTFTNTTGGTFTVDLSCVGGANAYWSGTTDANIVNSGLTKTNIGIGTDKPNQKLTVFGGISATTNIFSPTISAKTATLKGTLGVTGRTFLGTIDAAGDSYSTDKILVAQGDGEVEFLTTAQLRADIGDADYWSGSTTGGHIINSGTSKSNVGIGSDTPTHKFHVKGNSSSDNPVRVETVQGGRGYVLVIDDDGIVYKSKSTSGTISASTLEVTGDVKASGKLTGATLDISGNADINGTITGDLTGDVTGNASTATILATTRTIGGVGFNGSSNINLPGVNTSGNQDTSGTAAEATILETARNIGGVSFNGSANINLPGVNTTGNQNTSGNAATATILATARNIGGVSFNGSANIDLPGVNTSGNQNTSGTAAIATTVTVTDNESTNENNVIAFVAGAAGSGNVGLEADGNLTYNPSTGKVTATGFVGDVTGNITGNAATATALETARNIGGVSFDGTANINLPGVNTAGNQDTSGNAATATKIASITNSDIVQLTDSQTLTNKTLTSPVLNTGISGSAFLDEDDMASDSATKVASQQSIKAYVLAQVATTDSLQEVTDIGATTDNVITVAGLTTSGNITLNGDSDKIILGAGGDGEIYVDSDNLIISNTTSDKDILFNGLDNGSDITALTLDMSSGGMATFSNSIVATFDLKIGDNRYIGSASDPDAIRIAANGLVTFTAGLAGELTGNASTATILATARNIGGVSFNGSSNINLPGVNTAGNQNTSGNAATATLAADATTLATARNIGGVSFDGSANIDLPGVNTSGNQDTSGNAATSTKIASITNSDIVQLGGAQTLTGTKTLNSFKGTGSVTVTDIKDTDNFSDASATSLATSESIKAYVDASVPSESDTLQTVTERGATSNQAITLTNTLTVGVDDTGHDVKFFGATSGQYMLWDQSADKLIVTGEIEATKFDGALEGNADTATILATARNIGGVSFNGSANIDLPGVNTSGNQDTSGNAATATLAADATTLATARTIGGVSFDGSANINLPGVNTSGNQDTSGNAATSTKIASITNSDIVQLGGAQTLTGTKTLNSFKGTGSVTVTNILDEDNMSSDSATALVTQQSVKAYVDASVPSENDTLQTVTERGATSNQAITLSNTFTVGVDDTGHDVKFFGATSGQYMLWDESADKLIVTGEIEATKFDGALEGNADTATILATARNIGGVSFNGSANIDLPGVNTSGNQDTSGNAATATKIASITNSDIVVLGGAQTLTGTKTLNSFKGTGSVTVTNILDEDNMASDSATALATQQSIKAYVDASHPAESDTLQTVTSRGATSNVAITLSNTFTVGVDDTGHDVKFFGDTASSYMLWDASEDRLEVGASASPKIRLYRSGTGQVWEQQIDSSGRFQLKEAASAAGTQYVRFQLDDSGEATLYNTLTVPNVTGDLTGDVTGNADTATVLATARNIGGVSFNGSANINLPGVNATGNQDTSGNAATATILATARNIGGVSFNGSANIDLPGVNTAGNQNTSGTAAEATILETARTIGGVSFNGSANIDLPGVNTAGNQDTSGNAATSTKIASITNSDIVQLGGAQTLTGTKTLNSFKGTGSVTVTNILDEDNMASDSATALVTQQSVKAYVDASVPSESDTLQTVTSRGATSNVAITLSNDFTVGVNGTGHDVKFFGDTAGQYMLWDQSADKLIVTGEIEATKFDGALEGNADTATILATARNIGGVSFNGSANIDLPGVNTAGNQNTSGLAATATILATARNIGGVSFNGSANIDLPGVNTTGNQNTSGTAAVATTVTVTDESSDTTCFPVFAQSATGNVAIETGSNLTFNSSSGLLKAVSFEGDLTGDVTGNLDGTASSASVLATARTIGGVSFNGSANIDLPGVNTAGNQNTSGLAATATILATARNIGGVSFNGSANIDLPGVNTAGNQDTSGNAATSTKIASITNSDIVQLGGAQTLTGTKTLNSFKGTGSVTVTDIKDTDNFSDASDTSLATSESIKAYVDASVPSESDTLQTVTSRGATSNVAITLSNDFTVGVDDTGHDVKFFGATSGQYMLWDQSADKLIVTGEIEATKFDGALEGNADTATILATARNIGGVSFNGSANIDLPGVNTSGNQDTSGNAATATKIASITNSDIVLLSTTTTQTGTKTFSGVVDITNTTDASDATGDTGALRTEGGASIAKKLYVGSTITGDLTGDVTGNADTATVLATARNIGGVSFNGSANIDLPGVNTSGNQDTSGNAATATKIASITNSDIVVLGGAQTLTGTKTLNSFKGTGSVTVTNILDEDNMASDSATALATQQSIKAYVDGATGESDTLQTVTERGATSNQAITLSNTFTVGVDDTGHDVKFFGATSGQYMLWDQSADKLIVTGEIEATKFDGALEGNADTATILATARNIGGVSFNGSANIDLPGVNTAGNQDTSGNAATATILATARNIGGVSFNGSANIDLPGVNTAGNQDTSGNAATSTKIASITNSDIVQLSTTTTQTGTKTFSGVVDITNTTDSSDATGDTGALRTEGGASIAKKLYVGTDASIGGSKIEVADDLKIQTVGQTFPYIHFDADAMTLLTAQGETLTLGDNVSVNGNLLIASNLQHVGDDNNEISFGTDTQDFRTGNGSRLDISDSGVRLGGANSRVTTILDEDNMASDSATALATQQSIRAYVTSQVGASDTLQEVTDNGASTNLSITTAGLTSSGIVDITNTTDASDDTGDTGALRVEGGASIAKKLYVGSTITGNLTGDVTGNADTATVLATARNIGGVSFNGSANIDLPGVNTAGNQNTSGNAATATLAADATTLATARNIGGVSFDGSANIDLPGVNTAGNQDTSGNAATSTKIASITNSNIVQLATTTTQTGTKTFSGVIDITNTTDASDATGDTGALRTEGGASIAKKLYVGTSITTGNATLTSAELDISSGDFLLDVAGDITLDADGADIILSDAGTNFGRFKRDTSDFVIKSETNDKDILLKGVDNSSTITALQLDMSEAGKAIFNAGATFAGEVAMGSNKITGVTDPTSAQDAATKAYVDANAGGSPTLQDVTSNGATSNVAITLSNTLTVGTISSNSSDITLDSSADIVIDAAGGNIEFKDAGTLALTIDIDSTAGDAIFKDAGSTEIFRIDGSADSLLMATNKKIEFGDSGESIVGNGTSLTISSGADIILNPTGEVGIGTSTPVTKLDVLHNPTGIGQGTGGGEVVTFGRLSGEIQVGMLVYLSTGGIWTPADADAEGSTNPLLGITLTADGDDVRVLIRGFYNVVADYLQGTFRVGQPCYVSEATGSVDFTIPSADGDFVRIVGYATTTANVIYFNPSNDYIEIG